MATDPHLAVCSALDEKRRSRLAVTFADRTGHDNVIPGQLAVYGLRTENSVHFPGPVAAALSHHGREYH